MITQWYSGEGTGNALFITRDGKAQTHDVSNLYEMKDGRMNFPHSYNPGWQNVGIFLLTDIVKLPNGFMMPVYFQEEQKK